MTTTEHTGILKYVDDDGNVNILYPEIGKTMLKADFDRLPEEERNRGVYWVPDAESGGGGSNIELDTTLTVEGKAADAKAVGDAINNISNMATTVRYDSDSDVVQIKNGEEWIDWKIAGLKEVYLYNNGDVCSSVTGGWIETTNNIGNINTNGTNLDGSDSGYLVLYGYKSNLPTQYRHQLAVDMSSFKYLSMPYIVNITNQYSNAAIQLIGKDDSIVAEKWFVQGSARTENGTWVVDLSNLDESLLSKAYVKITIGTSASPTTNHTVRLKYVLLSNEL